MHARWVGKANIYGVFQVPHEVESFGGHVENLEGQPPLRAILIRGAPALLRIIPSSVTSTVYRMYSFLPIQPTMYPVPAGSMSTASAGLKACRHVNSRINVLQQNTALGPGVVWPFSLN